MRKGFVIDKVTKSIERRSTGLSYRTEVLPINRNDLKKIYKKNGWQFNWKTEYNHLDRQVFKLVLFGDDKIQGLLSLEPQPEQLYIEIHLIENAPHNFGKEKEFLGVAGNLVAFACKMSFEIGFNGLVAFTAKTSLIRHYIKTIRASVIYKNRMAIFTPEAKKLVNSYYKEYFNDE